MTARVTEPEANWAVSTYVVVITGLTGKAPEAATAPISVMVTLFAFIQDQVKTADSPRWMETLFAVKTATPLGLGAGAVTGFL